MQQNTKLLIVAESIDVNDSSGSKVGVALIQNLHKAGFDLKVYHYSRKELQLEHIACVAIKEQKTNITYIASKMQLLLRRAFAWNINPFIEKVFGFSFAFFNDSYSIKKALKKEDPSNYSWVFTLSKAASFRSHKAILDLPAWHTKWLAYVHDPYPMHFYPRPYNWVEPGYYKKQEFMRAISKACAFGVFPSLLLQEWMGSYFQDFLKRGVVIPHQISQNNNSEKAQLPTYFDSKKFTLVHAGSLMKPRDPKGLVEAYVLFLKNCPEAVQDSQLLFLGNNQYHKEYMEKQKNKVPSLHSISNYVDFNTVQKIQQEASVNIILESKAEISPFLPGKFPHCVQANKPILHLGPALSETRRLLGDEYPYVAEIDAVANIQTHIENLYNKWKQHKTELKLNKHELNNYLSVERLKQTILNLNH